MHSIGLSAAFLAGVASFLSPCVLPLIPGYISLISGISLDELSAGDTAPQAARKTALAALCFILGFTVVFTALGASASLIGELLGRHMGLLCKLAGALIILFGLHMSGLLPIRWLYYTKRADASRVAPGPIGAFLMGLAFAFGWTPCIGPILASILALAATQETIAQGIGLLFIYSMGLGIPFLVAALALNAFLRFFARFKRFLHWGEIAAGFLLVIFGVLVMTNHLFWLMRLLPPSFYGLSL